MQPTQSLVTTVDQVLANVLAPWVRDLGIDVTEARPDGSVELRVRGGPRLSREGGALCGQALLTLADTAMVAALTAAAGEFRPMATVSLTMTFSRPLIAPEIVVTATLLSCGKSLAQAEVRVYAAGSDQVGAAALVTYALLQPRKS